jgi:hypothetical protein
MKTAQVYDPITKQVSTIPEAELGPWMLQIEVVGAGRVWIQPGSLHSIEPGPICHPPLGPKLLKRIKKGIMWPLAEVCPKTLKEWEDGFRRDCNAEQQIAMWLVVAERFTGFLKANAGLNKRQRKEVFYLMLHCTVVPNRAAFWETVQLRFLTREQAESVIAPFEINWRNGPA